MDVFKELFEDLGSDVGARELRETMTTSDLPYLLTGAALDRALLKAYREYPADWEGYVYLDKVKDFRAVERLYEFGGEGALEQVSEQAPYTYAGLGEGKYTFSVAKYGRKISFSWEAFLNDDLGAFRRLAEKLARAARRTEHRLVTSLFVDASGPNASLFSTANGNLGTGVLDVTNLGAAITAIGSQRDQEGEPIYIEALHLVVPPALEIAAKSILEAIELRYPETSGVEWRTNNWVRNRLTLHVNPYLPIINTTSGNTNWFLFANPQDVESLIFARLRGHEEPEIFMKRPNATKIGGGEDPFNGDFDTDAIEYKVRHVCGGTVADFRGAYASTGVGT